jgi:hypothetical protein
VSARFVKELEPGHVLIIKKDGRHEVVPLLKKERRRVVHSNAFISAVDPIKTFM